MYLQQDVHQNVIIVNNMHFNPPFQSTIPKSKAKITQGQSTSATFSK